MARVNQGNAEKIKKYFGGAGRMLPWILIGIPLLFAILGVLFIGDRRPWKIPRSMPGRARSLLATIMFRAHAN
jgi:hypothetical protein